MKTILERTHANISTGKIRKYWRKIIKKLSDDKIANKIDDDNDKDDDDVDDDLAAAKLCYWRW